MGLSSQNKVMVLLTVLVIVFSIVWSSPAEVKRAYNPVPATQPNQQSGFGRNAHRQGRFFFSGLGFPNLTSLANLFKLNATSISFMPLGQMLFSG